MWVLWNWKKHIVYDKRFKNCNKKKLEILEHSKYFRQ